MTNVSGNGYQGAASLPCSVPTETVEAEDGTLVMLFRAEQWASIESDGMVDQAFRNLLLEMMAYRAARVKVQVEASFAKQHSSLLTNSEPVPDYVYGFGYSKTPWTGDDEC